MLSSALGMANRIQSAAALISALSLLSCNAFRRAGPQEADPVNPPAVVRVTIEYRQINECVAGSPRCDDDVVFAASWAQSGFTITLRPEPGRFVWRGTADTVPVNWPPRDQPYLVRVYDPHIVGGPTQGFTADRLKIGGELVQRFLYPGTPDELGLVFIDANGQGHNPF